MSKIKDGIIGHAVGDAMGVPVEFCIREKLLINPVTDMIGYGSHQVPEGFWSDDTSMEIALIDSYITKGKFDYDDIMTKFNNWVNYGEYTPSGEVFDIGRTCLQAIRNYSHGNIKATDCGLTSFNSNGNGSLMRILPVAYYCFYNKLKQNDIYNIVDERKNIIKKLYDNNQEKFEVYIFYICILQGKRKKWIKKRKWYLREIKKLFPSNSEIDQYFREIFYCK